MKPEPTATEIAAYAGMKLAEFASYFIIFGSIAAWWFITP